MVKTTMKTKTMMTRIMIKMIKSRISTIIINSKTYSRKNNTTITMKI